MRMLIDVVNFNADASCLDSTHWLSALTGGPDSFFCRWLLLYVRNRKRVVLGMTGSTVSDLQAHNPEAIELIRNHPEIFQIILRPYTHDIPLLRTAAGFRYNLMAGQAVLKSAFREVSGYYLPPELMLMGEQIAFLRRIGVKATFINPAQFTSDLADRIPAHPYLVKGLKGTELGCLPVQGNLTRSYLRTIQLWDEKEWDLTVETGADPIRLWRDGESSFLLPEGLAREEFWLTHCPWERGHLGNETYAPVPDSRFLRSYPVPSFSSWMKEFRMLGYVGRVLEVEKQLDRVPNLARYLWLLVIGSDILSAVEKSSPLVQLRLSPGGQVIEKYQIRRSERGYEGEEFLVLLEQQVTGTGDIPELNHPAFPHLIKAKGRVDHLKSLEPIWDSVTCC